MGTEVPYAFPHRPNYEYGMLAGSPDGCTEATLRAHGFKVGLPAGLVRAGLAVAKPEVVKAGGRTLSFVRVVLTDAGQRAFAPPGAQAAPGPV